MKFDRLGNPILRNQAHHFAAFFIMETNTIFADLLASNFERLQEQSFIVNNQQDVVLAQLAISIARKIKNKQLKWEQFPNEVFRHIKD